MRGHLIAARIQLLLEMIKNVTMQGATKAIQIRPKTTYFRPTILKIKLNVNDSGWNNRRISEMKMFFFQIFTVNLELFTSRRIAKYFSFSKQTHGQTKASQIF